MPDVRIRSRWLGAALAVLTPLSLRGEAPPPAPLPPFPVGLHIMLRPNLLPLREGEDRAVVRQLASGLFDAVALGAAWRDLEPEPGVPVAGSLNRIFARLDAATATAGLPGGLPVHLKLYPSDLPRWWRRADGDPDPGPRPPRRSPSSADPAYRAEIRRLVEEVAGWLGRRDPAARRVPVVHFAGPAMTSNTMRRPARRPDDPSPDPSREDHLAAWLEAATHFARQPAFAARYWVVNLTWQRPRGGSSGVPLEDQQAVVRALEGLHPAGPAGVIVKTESLCVRFQRGVCPPLGCLSFRKASAGGEEAPYRWISRRAGRHGWELWASFDERRDPRAPALLPVDELMENSLRLPPYAGGASQGTLFVELWPQVVPVGRSRLPPGLLPRLRAWRAEIHRLAPGARPPSGGDVGDGPALHEPERSLTEDSRAGEEPLEFAPVEEPAGIEDPVEDLAAPEEGDPPE